MVYKPVSYCLYQNTHIIVRCSDVCTVTLTKSQHSYSLPEHCNTTWTTWFEMLLVCLSFSTSLRWHNSRWTVCLVLLNPAPTPPPPQRPFGQPLSLPSFLGPTVGDLLSQVDTYGIPPLFMLWGSGVLESCTMAPQWGGGVASEFPHHSRVRIYV